MALLWCPPRHGVGAGGGVGGVGVRTMLQRAFVVNAPLPVVWDHLSQVEAWPSWAGHIRRVHMDPPGGLTARSRGRFRLRGGIRSTFVVTDFDPPSSWAWAGPFLWLTVHYDHRFEALGERQTRLVWTVAAQGRGVAVLGRLFAAGYARATSTGPSPTCNASWTRLAVQPDAAGQHARWRACSGNGSRSMHAAQAPQRPRPPPEGPTSVGSIASSPPRSTTTIPRRVSVPVGTSPRSSRPVGPMWRRACAEASRTCSPSGGSVSAAGSPRASRTRTARGHDLDRATRPGT